jgi:hypothetical protein
MMAAIPNRTGACRTMLTFGLSRAKDGWMIRRPLPAVHADRQSDDGVRRMRRSLPAMRRLSARAMSIARAMRIKVMAIRIKPRRIIMAPAMAVGSSCLHWVMH